jgi:hypothetical protein
MENGLQGYDNGATLASACDEAVCAWEGSNVNYFFNGAWSSLKPLTSTWSDSYWAIRACNFYLENCNDYTFEDYKYNKDYLDQMERYNRYQYEVRFLRAYFYFNLVRTYGDVPLIKETLTDKEANSVSRTSSEDVFSFIVDECDKIMNKLPDDYNQVTYVDTGRITSLTVAALKARALMYAASPLFYKGDNVKEAWHNAAKANKDVIQMSAKLGVIFVKKALDYSKNKDFKQVWVHFQKDRFEIVVTKNQQLLLFNTFLYKTIEDFIYYLLFTYEQLQLNPEVVPVQFIGAISEEHDCFKYRKVCRSKVYAFGQFTKRNLSFRHHYVQIYYYRHIVSFLSIKWSNPVLLSFVFLSRKYRQSIQTSSPRL